MKNLKRLIREEIDDSMDWIRQHDFHLDLMSQNKRNIESLSEVKKILFNPAVQTSSEKFKTVAYYLEDMNYMPENLIFDEYLSYIEIKRHPQGKGLFIKNGKYFVGPTVSDDTLIEMSKEVGSFWFEEFVTSFLPNKSYR
jgi:hypothetical protein